MSKRNNKLLATIGAAAIVVFVGAKFAANAGSKISYTVKGIDKEKLKLSFKNSLVPVIYTVTNKNPFPVDFNGYVGVLYYGASPIAQTNILPQQKIILPPNQPVDITINSVIPTGNFFTQLGNIIERGQVLSGFYIKGTLMTDYMNVPIPKVYVPII